MTAPRRPALATAVAACVVAALVLAGCADRDPEPVATSPVTPAASAPVASPSGAPSTAASAPATPVLPGMPVPTAVGASPVDSSTITSLGSLPAAFRCPTAPSPITIPAITPAAAAGAPTPTPAAVVCPSALAGGEALYLWYAPTPALKLAALTAALKQTTYVHGGPNWVAGGTVDKAMGTVGGELYR